MTAVRGLAALGRVTHDSTGRAWVPLSEVATLLAELRRPAEFPKLSAWLSHLACLGMLCVATLSGHKQPSYRLAADGDDSLASTSKGGPVDDTSVEAEFTVVPASSTRRVRAADVPSKPLQQPAAHIRSGPTRKHDEGAAARSVKPPALEMTAGATAPDAFPALRLDLSRPAPERVLAPASPAATGGAAVTAALPTARSAGGRWAGVAASRPAVCGAGAAGPAGHPDPADAGGAAAGGVGLDALVAQAHARREALRTRFCVAAADAIRLAVAAAASGTDAALRRTLQVSWVPLSAVASMLPASMWPQRSLARSFASENGHFAMQAAGGGREACVRLLHS